jgi:putative endonuclease
MMYTVYILYSIGFTKTYTGYTSDLDRRFVEHNITGENGFTKSYRPWILIYSEIFKDKTEAIKRERYYKTGVGRDKIKAMVAAYNLKII